MVDFRAKQAFYIGECWKNWLMPILRKVITSPVTISVTYKTKQLRRNADAAFQ